MRCYCEKCESNDSGYCLLIGRYVTLDENGVCTDMVVRREKEENDDAVERAGRR